MAEGDEQSQREVACLRFVENCAVPIFGVHAEEAVIFGTGALFRTGDVACLLTARHAINDLEEQVGLEQAVVPLRSSALAGPRRSEKGIGEFREKLCPTIRLCPMRAARAKVPAEDIGALVLDSQDVVRQLEQSFHILAPSQLLAGDQQEGRFYVAGYPRDAGLKVEGGLSSRFFYFGTERISCIPDPVDWKEPPDPNVDFFLKPPQRILNQHGQPIKKPNLKGMSGCLVWVDSQTVPPRAIWLPHQQMRIAGIQTSCIGTETNSAIRTTNAEAVGRLLAALPLLAKKNSA